MEAGPPFKGSAPPTTKDASSSSPSNSEAKGLVLQRTLPQNGPAKSYMTSNSDIAGWNDAPKVIKKSNASSRISGNEETLSSDELHRLFEKHLEEMAASITSSELPLGQKMLDDAGSRLQPLMSLLKCETDTVSPELIASLGNILQGTFYPSNLAVVYSNG